MSDDDNGELHWSTVYTDMLEGKLESLAIYLRQTNGQIDGCVARRLAAMIDEKSTKAKFRISVVRRKIGAKTRPLGQQLEIARFMAKSGAGKPGGYESALELSMEQFGVKQSTVKAAWKKWKTVIGPRERALEALREKTQGQKSPDFIDPE